MSMVPTSYYPTPVPTPTRPPQQQVISQDQMMSQFSFTPGYTTVTPQAINAASGGGQILGANTVTPTTTSTPAPSAPANTNPVPSIDPLLQEINNIYNPTYDYLNNLQSQLQSNYPTVQTDITNQYNTSKTVADTEKGQADRDITSQEEKAGKRKVDAKSAAKRLFNELQRSGMQRYGGATSAGQAFSELSNTELQRNMGGIESNYSDSVNQINMARQNLNEKYGNITLQLETQKNEALNEARREFDNKMLEVNRMKTSLDSEKSQMRLQALQELRNQVYAINVQNLQFSQQLALQKQNSDSQLERLANQVSSSVTGAQGAAGAFNQNTTLNPQTGLTPYYSGNNGASNTPVITGIKKNDDVLSGNPFGL